jgi:hypothetical protein
MSSNQSSEASLLVSELEHLAEKQKGSSLPSVQQLYVIGGLLCRIGKQAQEGDLTFAYQHLIDSLPETFLKKVFLTFHKVLTTLLEESKSFDDLTEASEALAGLLTNSPAFAKLPIQKTGFPS